MKKRAYLISCFPRPVTNKTDQYQYRWPKLFKILMGPPRILSEYTPEQKMRLGDYFVRGVIENGEAFPKRCDENLACCNLVILDIDHAAENAPLPTPGEIHSTLKKQNIAHVVHTSANPERCRVVMPCQVYEKENTDAVTWAAYCFLKDRGITFAYATESRVYSQPWFLPQTSDIARHVALGEKNGLKFNPYPLQKTVPIPEEIDNEAPKIGSAPTAEWVISQIRDHNTLHQAAKRYAGWLRKTTDWSVGQIFDEITGLINTAGVEEFIERWPKEREKFERWFEEQQFDKKAKIDPQILKAINSKDCCDGLGCDYMMTENYLNELGAEEWVYKNLIIARQVTVVIAKPGGGKTSFMLNIAAPEIAKSGYTVFYVDVDSPPSDHKMMNEIAKKNKFFLVAPNTIRGKSIKTYMETMDGYIEIGANMDRSVFIFDTMKKFVDMMSKKDLKIFLGKMKQLTALGATVVLLGHANKHLNAEGLMVFEGTGDVQSDADNLIFFAAEHNDEAHTTKVSTVVSQNLGAKVRGIFKPFTFEVSKKSRKVHLLEDAPPVQYPHEGPVTLSQAAAMKFNDGAILKALVDFLKENADQQINAETLRYGAQSKVDVGENRIRTLINANSVNEDIEVGMGLFKCERTGKRRHIKVYSLTEKGQRFAPAETFDQK